jgi:hypothetical protein
MRSKQVVCIVALLVLLVTVTVSVAAIFEITYEVTLDDIDDLNRGTGVLGVSQAVTMTTSFTIDTEAAPVLILPSGTVDILGRIWPTLYGYSRAAISGLSVTFGTQTWNVNDLRLLLPASVPFGAEVWFDAPLADGATPKTAMVLESLPSGNLMEFGVFWCSLMSCFLLDNVRVEEDTTSGTVLGNGMNVTVSASQLPHITPPPIPRPAQWATL